MQVSLIRSLFLLSCIIFGIAGCGRKEIAPAAQAAYDFSVPRTAWVNLDADARAALDAGLANRPKPAMCVIHSTGSPSASLAGMTDNHSRVRGLTGGMAYHFVIGNGHGIPDGALVPGSRWIAGLPSAAGDDLRQDRATISICLVGEFNRKPPTPAQLQTLDELLDYLTGKIGPYPVRLHREIENSHRDCPGKHFPVHAMRLAYPL